MAPVPWDFPTAEALCSKFNAERTPVSDWQVTLLRDFWSSRDVESRIARATVLLSADNPARRVEALFLAHVVATQYLSDSSVSSLAAPITNLLIARHVTGAPSTQAERFALVDLYGKARLVELNRLDVAGHLDTPSAALTPKDEGERKALRTLVYERLQAQSKQDNAQLSKADVLLLTGLQLELVRAKRGVSESLPPTLAERKGTYFEQIAEDRRAGGVDIPFDVIATSPAVIELYTRLHGGYRHDTNFVRAHLLQWVTSDLKGLKDLSKSQSSRMRGLIDTLTRDRPWRDSDERWTARRVAQPSLSLWSHPLLSATKPRESYDLVARAIGLVVGADQVAEYVRHPMLWGALFLLGRGLPTGTLQDAALYPLKDWTKASDIWHVLDAVREDAAVRAAVYVALDMGLDSFFQFVGPPLLDELESELRAAERMIAGARLLLQGEQSAQADLHDTRRLGDLHRRYAINAQAGRDERLTGAELRELQALRLRMYERLATLSRAALRSRDSNSTTTPFDMPVADLLLYEGLRLELVRQESLAHPELLVDPSWIGDVMQLADDLLSGKAGVTIQSCVNVVQTHCADKSDEAIAWLSEFLQDGHRRVQNDDSPQKIQKKSSLDQLKKKLQGHWLMTTATELPSDFAKESNRTQLLEIVRRAAARNMHVPFDIIATSAAVQGSPAAKGIYQELLDSRRINTGTYAAALFLECVIYGQDALRARRAAPEQNAIVGLLDGLKGHERWMDAALRADAATGPWDHPVLTDTVITGAALQKRKVELEKVKRADAEMGRAKEVFSALAVHAETRRTQGPFEVPPGQSVLTYLGVLYGGMLCFYDWRFQTDVTISADAFDDRGALKPHVVAVSTIASGAGCVHSSMEGVLHLAAQEKKFGDGIGVAVGSSTSVKPAETVRIAFDHPGQGRVHSNGPNVETPDAALSAEERALIWNQSTLMTGPDVGQFEKLSDYVAWLQSFHSVYAAWLTGGTAVSLDNGRSLGGQLSMHRAVLGLQRHGYAMGAWHPAEETAADEYILAQMVTDAGFAMSWPVITMLTNWGGALPSWLTTLRDRLNGEKTLGGTRPAGAGTPLPPLELRAMLPPRLLERMQAGENFAAVLGGVLDADHLSALDRGEAISIPAARLGRDVRVNLDITRLDMAPIFRDPERRAVQVRQSEWTFTKIIAEQLPTLRAQGTPFIDPVTGDSQTLDEVLAMDWADMMLAEVREDGFRSWTQRVLKREGITVGREDTLTELLAKHRDAIARGAVRTVLAPDKKWMSINDARQMWETAREAGGKMQKAWDDTGKRYFGGVLTVAGISLEEGQEMFDAVQQHWKQIQQWSQREIDDMATFEEISFAELQERLPALQQLTDRWRAIQAYLAKLRDESGVSDMTLPLNLVGKQDPEYQYQHFAPGQVMYDWQPPSLSIAAPVNLYGWQAFMAVTGGEAFFNPWAGHDHLSVDRVATRDIDTAMRRADLPADDLEHGPAVPEVMRRTMADVLQLEREAAEHEDTEQTIALSKRALGLRKGLANKIVALSASHISRYKRALMAQAAPAWNAAHADEGRQIVFDAALD